MNEQQTVAPLNDCFRGGRTWLTKSTLKLNEEKTEAILFTSKHGFNSLPDINVAVGEQQQ